MDLIESNSQSNDNPENFINNNNNKKILNKRSSNLNWLKKINQGKKNVSRSKSQLDIEGDSPESMIAKAKIHQRANRPLIKLKEFDGGTKFCQCCYLPAEDDKYLRKCTFCENTDEFANYGRGTSLYFSYYRFSIVILIFTVCLIALPSFFLTNYYTNHLIDICGKIYDIEGNNIAKTFPDCVNFINIEGVSEYFIKKGDWEFKYNGLNLKYFRKVYKNIVGNDDNVDKVLTNFHITSFFVLVSLFIINILYIILLFNINHKFNLSITSPSDFTIIITNFHSAFEIFWKNIIKINSVIKAITNKIHDDNDTENDLKKCEKEIEILGLKDYPKDKEINIFEGFKHFIMNKICIGPNGEKFNIYRINVCYKINEFMQKEEEIQEIKKKIYKINNQKYQIKKNEELKLKGDDRKYFYNLIQNLGLDFCNCSLCENSQTLSDLEKEKNKLENKLKELLSQTNNLTKENFSGVVLVTFNTIVEAEKFMEPYPKNLIMSIFVAIKNLKYFLCSCCVDKSKRDHFFLNRSNRVNVAPEPEDVIFENLQYSSIERLFRTFLVYFLSLIIICICFVIILFLNDYQIKKMKNNANNFVIKYGIALLINLIISMLNTTFQYILEGLTKREKHISNTNYYLSFSIKLTIFTFVTSAVIPLISSYYHSSSKYDLLLANMLTLFLTNSFLTPIMWSLNYECLTKSIKRCLISGNYQNYTQDELNKIYELLDMNVSYKYSYIFKTLLMSFFYIPIFPLGIAISFFGFIFGYFLEKINFAQFYKKPEMLNSKICEFYSNYFIINFFMLCLGNYIFLRDNNKSNLWCISNLCIFGILIIIPYNQIFAFDFIGIKESDLKGDKTYEDFYFTFYNDYEKINPMTKKDSIKKFLDRLLQDKLMSKDDYDKILQNIDKVNLMEFYYKARKNFADSLLMKVFMNMPELDNRNKTIKRKSFLDRLKEHSRTNKIRLINLILAQINQNNNKNNTEQSDNDNNNENANNNNKNNNNDLIAQTQQRSSIRGLNINPLEQLTNQLSGNLSSINTNTNRVGNNININISINITKEDKDKKKEDKENKNKKRKSSLSKKNMDIFKHLIKTEQNKILSYYRNPVLFGMKKMMEGIIFDKKEEKEDKKDINNLNKINEMIEDSADEKNSRTLKDKDIAGKKKIKIKVKKKIKKKIKVKKKKKKTIENDSISNSNSNGYNNNIEIQDYDNEPSF